MSPKMTMAMFNGRTVDIEEALHRRDEARESGKLNPSFDCIECEKSVRAHKSGRLAKAHFEHQHRNPDCSLSVP